MPDVFLWKYNINNNLNECLIVENESINDKLSKHQRYIIYFLTKNRSESWSITHLVNFYNKNCYILLNENKLIF